jgi:hypothetical protein
MTTAIPDPFAARRIDRPNAEVFTLFSDDDSGDWVHVVIDEQTGLFMATGSYGTYAHQWPPQHLAADTLKEFLLGVDRDYFLSKTVPIGQREVFDPEATLWALKDQILEARKLGDLSLTREQARAAWTVVESLRDEIDPQEIVNALQTREPVCRLFRDDTWEFLRDRISPQCELFWDKIWPQIAAELARRLDVEEAKAQAPGEPGVDDEGEQPGPEMV